MSSISFFMKHEHFPVLVNFRQLLFQYSFNNTKIEYEHEKRSLINMKLNLLSANPTKWSNHSNNLPTNCPRNV